MNYGIIMAGGRGERFWPLSNEAHPKQLIAITSEKSMLQITIDRIVNFIPIENLKLVTGENIRDSILEKCPRIKPDNMLCEPTGRNTCLAIGLAAIHLNQSDPDGVMVVLSADHLINPATKLISIIKAGTKIAAKEDKLLTIGIVPTRAETGYGYIEISDDQWNVDGVSVCKVSAFKEKPRPTIAQEYYYDRKHLWNSGMFIWSVKAILKAFEQHMPEMYGQLIEYATNIDTDNELAARAKLYEEAEPISIDVAILEQADNVLTMKGDFIWDDIGSWLSLERFMETDKEHNVVRGEAIMLDSYESTVYNNGDGIIATIGVSDLVVVRSGDVVMVVHKTKLDRIKDLLVMFRKDEKLKKYL